jgi:type I restriction enzyme S subunit
MKIWRGWGMYKDWDEYKLSDVMTIYGGGTPKRSESKYWNGKIPWVSVQDLNGNSRHIYKAKETITEEGLRNSSARILKEKQIIISARGTVGALAQLGIAMAFNQSCYGLEARDTTTNDFLYYLLRYKLSSLKQITHGAVFDTITRETFNHITIKLPPSSQQKAIADILGSLDDKIELNRKMNETLEEMAQTFFKSWFIDFDPVHAKAKGQKPHGVSEEIAALFPSGFEESQLGMIPKGWSIKTLADCIDVSGGRQLRSELQNWDIDKYPVYGGNGIMGFSDTCSHENFVIILGRVGANCGSIHWSYGGVWINNNASSLIPRSNNEFFLQAVLNIDFSLYRKGSAQPFIPQSTINTIELLIPSIDLAKEFTKQSNSIRIKINHNIRENNHLSSLRDTLLPKLLSGEISVKEAEKQVQKSI